VGKGNKRNDIQQQKESGAQGPRGTLTESFVEKATNNKTGKDRCGRSFRKILQKSWGITLTLIWYQEKSGESQLHAEAGRTRYDGA